MLENWVGQLFALAGRYLLAGAEAVAPCRAGVGRSTKVDRSYRVSPASGAIRSPRWSTGSRASTPPRPCGGCSEAGRREHQVAYPIEVRFVAADDVALSASHGRDTCYIAVHQDRKLDWEPYFRGVEEIMDSRRATPLGKRHFQTAATLAPVTRAGASFRTCGRSWTREGCSATRTPIASSGRSLPTPTRDVDACAHRKDWPRPVGRGSSTTRSPSIKYRELKRSHSSPALAWRR